MLPSLLHASRPRKGGPAVVCPPRRAGRGGCLTCCFADVVSGLRVHTTNTTLSPRSRLLWRGPGGGLLVPHHRLLCFLCAPARAGPPLLRTVRVLRWTPCARPTHPCPPPLPLPSRGPGVHLLRSTAQARHRGGLGFFPVDGGAGLPVPGTPRGAPHRPRPAPPRCCRPRCCRVPALEEVEAVPHGPPSAMSTPDARR